MVFFIILGIKKNAAKKTANAPISNNNHNAHAKTNNTDKLEMFSAVTEQILILMKQVEELTGVDLSTSNDKDTKELMQSMVRWSKILAVTYPI